MEGAPPLTAQPPVPALMCVCTPIIYVPWRPQLDGGAYLGAARNGDLAMLRCLHRLGCPWGPPGELLTDCIRSGVSVAVLRCLLDLGCPEMDWDAAVKLAEDRARMNPWERHPVLLAWLGEQQQRRRSPGPQGA
ncbi:hypothetical protein PLESTF_000540100 [Pleodorina starrii]|nr:hypothetical protein PLESTF_000540100 [Pleodorina starrii]